MTNSATNLSYVTSRRKRIGSSSAFNVDPLVEPHLKELDRLLGKRVLTKATFTVSTATGAAPLSGAAPAGSTPPATPKGKGKTPPPAPSTASPRTWSPAEDEARPILAAPLTPRYAPLPSSGGWWAAASFAATLEGLPEKATHFNLSLLVERVPALAKLRAKFRAKPLPTDRVGTALLAKYPAILDYLIARAYLVDDISDGSVLRETILGRNGVGTVLKYLAVSGARTLIDLEQRNVKDHNLDTGDFVARFDDASGVLSEPTYRREVERTIREFVFDGDESRIVDKEIAGKRLDPRALDVKHLLIKYMQASPVPITDKNAKIYLPGLLVQALKATARLSAVPLPEDPSLDSGFDGGFIDDGRDETAEVSVSAVQCAAQLYHTMVLGDELDVFGAANYLTNRRLLSAGGIKIRSPGLRRDLQNYVFNNEFTDLDTGTTMHRTRPAERQMFFRQVFDQGATQAPEDMPINSEFPQLWKVLMLESARYLERAQSSMHPDAFVTGQNVMQAVEDLQYNLSTTCTGMATVMAPVAAAELKFVLTRILMHPEIIQQVVPEGGTWRRAVDKLNAERRKSSGNASTLYNKAQQGKEIIRAIAAYTAGALDDMAALNDFVYLVDGFITTQSILQRRKRPAMRDEVEDEDLREDTRPALEHESGGEMREPATAEAGAGEWDF